MKIDFFFDFETRSRLDLRKVGAVRYATDPSTEATLLTWAFGRLGKVKAWRYGQPIPSELYDVAMYPEKYNMVAHNVLFDYLIWREVWGKKNIPDLKSPKIDDLTDNMAHTCYFRVGGSLDNAAKTLGLPLVKDKDGRRIMLKQCKPDRKGQFPVLTTEEWDKFEHYGIIDTVLLRDIYYTCPPLPPSERYIWEWTFKRNLRGLRIDMPLLEEMNDILQNEKPKLVKEFNHHVAGKCKINSPTTLKPWFQQYYPWIENMQGDTIREMLADRRPEIPDFARRALECKALAGSTSLAKIETAVAKTYQGRIYEVLAYHYAHTKRWAGRGIQVQNFPRPEGDPTDAIDFNIDTHDLVGIVKARRPGLQDPLGFIKNLLRRIFIPDQGKTFYCGDWSKIEPTVLFWLTGIGDISAKWYEDMASTIYAIPIDQIGKESEERQVGKAAALGCGYGLGPTGFSMNVFKQTGLRLTEDTCKRAVYAYRNKYPQIVNLWKDLERGIRHASEGATVKVAGGKITIMPLKVKGKEAYRNVQIILPSGGKLFYHDVRENSGRISFDSSAGFRKDVYGGLLCEHVTSATAREILVPAIWRLEQAGFDVLNTIHDELHAQAEAGREQEYLDLMCVKPAWCQDMKITADGGGGKRWLK